MTTTPGTSAPNLAGTEFYTPDTLAKLCNAHRNSVYRWIERGTGPTHVRINGRILFRAADVAAWMAENTHYGTTR